MAFKSLGLQAEASWYKQYLNPTYLVIGGALALFGTIIVKLVGGIFTPKSK